MFKIESYITPIIINYIDKYVKDFRPQNAQVSLWGGAVSFQNLDIRLDVLQQELYLPLNIVSGHIHELTVRVPWTKIASEPIQINVNTIEFVVKLKSDGERDNSDKEAETATAAPIIQEPPGYMASLINKIANNISIKLNNIIFKYIEEDIVLSMNIQTLAIDSADDDWQPAFIDINSTKVTLKKVINVHDLTICLDRPNAQGKIDVCQEPILYRCSLQARMIRKYNLQTAHLASMTRIDVFTDNIDFKISVQQVPMLIRLYLLVQMLREVHTNRYANRRRRHKADTAGSVSGVGGDEIDGVDNSYATWIWNMLPEIFPPDEDDERIETHDHIFHNGFYAKNVSFMLKSQEIVSSSIIQTTTAFKYHPILKVSLSGLSFDAVSIGRKWYNMKGGIAYIGIFPLGSCTCGQKHNLPTLFLSGRKIRGDNESFLMDSLKDPNCCENQNQNRVYDSDFHTHLLLNTEDELLQRNPALAWDIVSHKQASDEGNSYSGDGGGGGQSLSSYDADITSTEEYYVRAIFGSFNWKIDTSLTHLWQTLTDQYQQYTYTAPYLIVEKTDSLAQLVPPSTEDYESLLDCIPLRKYNLFVNKSLIEFYNLDADHSQSSDANEFHNLPFTLITLRRAEINQTSPLYPDKLVHTTCQLPDPTELLKEHCYYKTSVVITEMRVDVVYKKHQFNALSLANVEMSQGVLIKPEFWLLTPMKTRTINLMAAEAKLTFNKPQLMLLLHIGQHFNASDPILVRRHIKNFHFVDLSDVSLPVLEIFLRRLQATTVFTENTIGASVALASMCGYCSVQDSERLPKSSTIFISNEDIKANLLNCSIQYPIEMANAKYSPTLCVKLGKLIVNFDRIFQCFLNYRLSIEHVVEHSTHTEEKIPKRVRKTSKVNKPMIRTESVHSNSVTTLSAVNSVHKAKEQDKVHSINWHAVIKRLILHVDLKSVTILCPNKTISLLTDESTASSLRDLYLNCNGILMTIFRLPSIEIQTSKFKNIQHVIGKNQFPIQLIDTDSPPSTGFPWTIELNDFSCSNLLDRNEIVFLPPVHTKLTLDLLSTKPKDNDAQVDDMSFVIHLDTTPITLNLCTTQVKQIFQSVNALASYNRVPEKKHPTQLLDASTSFYDAQINDFIGETTTSDKSSEEVVSEKDKTTSKINCLIQWTITKFTLSLTGSNELAEIELALELEDIISSVDKQSTYTKVKTKFGSLNGVRKRRDCRTGSIDLLNIIGKSDILIEEAQETFFEMISTTAMANNVHNRWGANTRKALGFRDGTETITELMVNMQSIDIKVELDVLTVILSINDEILRAQASIANDQQPVSPNVTCVKDLPLIFFDCKGLQMWIPHLIETESRAADVLIVKINAMTITPSVENPIQRKPVREDIYTKAAQLRMINTPGALIEDRQYELLFKNISLVTGNRNEILSFAQPQNNENPAFDWNHQIQKPSLNVNTLCNDFVVSIIFAPAIVFQNIIVCGQALEVNCVNDLAVDVTLNDLIFLNNLCQNITTILCHRSTEASSYVMSDPNAKRLSIAKCVRQNSCQKMISSHDQFDSDSGFKSNLCNERTKSNAKAVNALRTEIPHSFSFVGGLFTIQMFKNTPSDDIEASIPLISVRMDQPNLLIMRDIVECHRHISLSNLSFRLFDETIFAKTSQTFGDIVLDTHRGELDESGITPTLFELKQISSQNNNETKIVCVMRKPLQLRFTPKSIQKLLSLKDTISDIFSGEQVGHAADTPLQPIVRYNKISEIRKLFGNATTVDFHMSKFIVDLMSSTNCLLSMCLYKLDSKVSAQEYPEQLTLNVNLNSLAVNTDCSMVLHPTTVDFDCILTQEKWNRRLLVVANIAANIIDLQISPTDIQTLAKIQVEFMTCMQQRNDEGKVDADQATERPHFDRDCSIQVVLPPATNQSAHTEDQFFQDDLRLGTFEYITVVADDSLPLPYQIYLSNGPNEMQICWRYPHPRTINFVQIYPIPGHTSMRIKCRLEYLHESHNTFFPHVLFEIGNRKRCDIELPKRRLAASVWRIVLLDPLASLRDLELELDDTDIVFDDLLNPKTIIGCIRIDTIFSVRNISIVQANLRVNRLSLAILNNVCILKHQVPDLLQQYSLKVEEHVRNTQEFCAINFTEVNASVALHTDMEWKVYNEFTIDVNVFDSSYLTMVPLIDRVPIKCYIENNTLGQPNIACVTAGKLRIRYGPSIGCAIAIAEQIWQNILRDVESKHRLPIMTRFVVCNSTSAPIRFGQDQTDEQIWLQQNECFYYAFRAINLPQKLKFSIRLENNIVDVGDTFVVDDRENINYFGVGDGKYLLISSRKVSSTQRKIMVKGQIEVLNMTKETFQIHYKTKTDKTDAEDATVKNQCGILLAPAAIGSILEVCNDTREASVRLQLAGGDANGWSGEIPLNRPASTIPWIVKVPTKSTQKFITYTVRIHSEYIEYLSPGPQNRRPKRLLIVIWPLFTARSLMPTHLTAIDTEHAKQYLLMGKGACRDLQVAGTFDTEHNLMFALQQESSWNTMLTYKTIDKKAFFAIPERFRSVDDVLKELERTDDLKWPCSNEEEILIERRHTADISTPPIFKFSASRELSCSMQLDVIPWALCINALRYEMKLVDANHTEHCTIQPNQIAVPLTIENAFQIKLKIDNQWHASRFIHLYESRLSIKQFAALHLPENGSIVFEMNANDTKMVKLCVSSSVENSTRIVTVAPFFVICNYSAHSLSFSAFCMHRNDKRDFKSIARILQSNQLASNTIPDNRNKDASDPFKGCECSTFCNLSPNQLVKSSNTDDFNYFLVVEVNERIQSAPIYISKPLNRTAFGISGEDRYIALAASVTEHHQYQYYVSLYEDRYPFIEIDNRTNIDIFVAEADFADFSKSLKPKKSIHDDNFPWLCAVKAFSCLNYTPPSINERFAEKQNQNVHLIFGCENYNQPMPSIQWSIPIETNKSDEKYLALPFYGDIKMTSSIANKTIKFLLQHIDFKKEFNVKVVHTKLSSSNTKDNMAVNDSLMSHAPPPTSKTDFPRSKPSSLNSLNIDVYIEEITITMYDEEKNALHKKNDIVSLFFDDVLLAYAEEKRTLEFGFSNIQIDNRLFSTGKYDFPVILCGQNTKKMVAATNESEAGSGEIVCDTKCDSLLPTPFSLHLMKAQLFDHQLAYIRITMEASVMCPRDVLCSVKPLRIYVEDKFISSLLDFVIENLPSNIIYMSNTTTAPGKRIVCETGESLVPHVVTQQILSFLSEPLRLEHICIKPLSVLLSVHTCMRMYIALDHSPLQFAQFESRNVYTTTMRFGYNIGMHYVSDAIFGAGWVVGSLEILGSPSGLARSVSTGLWDFVSMPVQGLMRGPWGVLLGITYGSASLVKHITAGTVNSVTKLAASVARNLDRLTLDDEHLERTEALRRTRPLGITHGITQGLTGFGINILSAVGGISRHVLEANNTVGVFTGLGKGLLGVVTKPISGAAELLALTGQGVLQSVGYNTLPIQRSIQCSIETGHTMMSPTKVMWKFLSKINYMDRVLVAVNGTLVDSSNKSQVITFAVTTELIVLIALESNELIKVLAITNTRVATGIKTSAVLYLNGKSDDESQHYHHKRILQYLSKAYEQTSENRSTADDESQTIASNEPNKIAIVFDDANKAHYLSKYIQFLNFCLSSNK